jgi:hypothetical protein
LCWSAPLSASSSSASPWPISTYLSRNTCLAQTGSNARNYAKISCYRKLSWGISWCEPHQLPAGTHFIRITSFQNAKQY